MLFASIAAAFAGFACLFVHLERERAKLIEEIREIESLSGRIELLDERLTLTARLASALDRPALEERYRRAERELTGVLDRMRRMRPAVLGERDAAALASVEAVSDANDALVDLENRSFEEVRAGRGSRGTAILESDEYAKWKAEYSAGAERARIELERLLDVSLESHREQLLAVTLSVLAGALAIVAAVCAGVLRDQAALREWARRYETLVENLPGAAYRAHLDADYTAVLVSSGIEKVTGYPASDFVGNRVRSLASVIHPDDRAPVFADTLDRFVRDPQGSADLEFRIVHRSGDVRWVNARGRATGDGMIEGVFFDVTDRKLLEIELAQTRKLESIGQLAAGIAHEINTPAQFVSDNVHFLSQSVDGLFELVDGLAKLAPAAAAGDVAALRAKAEYDFVRAEVPRALEQSSEGIGRIARIVSAMKDFSHPSKGDKAPADLNAAIETTLTVCTNRWKDVARVETELDPDLPRVFCIRDEINQVLLNLIVNAVDAIAESRAGAQPAGLGTIRIATRRDGDAAVVRVEDDGAGMPVAVRERIVDPFFTTKPVGKGTGQGLSIARSVIVERHGGLLACESEPGRGTAFTVRLPIGGAAATDAAA
jgi:PAS domain S-box-containing protein